MKRLKFLLTSVVFFLAEIVIAQVPQDIHPNTNEDKIPIWEEPVYMFFVIGFVLIAGAAVFYRRRKK